MRPKTGGHVRRPGLSGSRRRSAAARPPPGHCCGMPRDRLSGFCRCRGRVAPRGFRRRKVSPCNRCHFSRSANGCKATPTRPTQSAKVDRDRMTLSRAAICSSRYSGRWSWYLLTITQANRPTAAMPPSITAGGIGAAVTVSAEKCSCIFCTSHIPVGRTRGRHIGDGYTHKA